jgi:HEAT repeat protein
MTFGFEFPRTRFKKISMTKWLTVLIALCGLLTSVELVLVAADQDEEVKLIQVLESGASPAEKDAACARLKFIGKSRCVPALAALLTDEQLSHSARYALEAMQGDEAGNALLDALGKTKGLIRLGIINSLGVRAETRAASALVQLLQDQDANTAGTAALALGQIGGPEALKGLRNFSRTQNPALHQAAVDSLLRCANRLAASGERSGALAIFEQLDIPTESETVQVAAFQGRVHASGTGGLSLALHAISGPTGSDQLAALQLVRDLQGPNATLEFARLLPDVQPDIQLALVGGLDQRGDPAAVPSLVRLANGNSTQSEVRLAVIRALENLGDNSVVGLLSGVAAASDGEEQRAARQALEDLHRGDVTATLIEQLTSGTPQVQTESARALGARGDKAAVPKLLDLAQRGQNSTRKSALQALSVLIDNSQLAALVNLVLQSKDQAGSAPAAEALNAAYQRLQTARGQADTEPLVRGIAQGTPEARAALLSVCGGLTDAKVRAALRTAIQDPDPQVRSAAIRALCETPDAELVPDVLELAHSTQDESIRSLAIFGAVRLLTQEEGVKLPVGQRVEALKSLLSFATNPEQKRKVLAGLGEVPDIGSLRVVDTAFADTSVGNEAARAAVKITSTLPDKEACLATLKKAQAAATDAGTRQAVQAALEQIQQTAEYLTDWEVSGPYQQADKDYAALFDIAFAPESKDSGTAKWTRLAAGSDPKRPGVMDLAKALGGQQRVAYARTWLNCDRDCDAILELGSDDGVKVWLNEKQVYAVNVARPLQPGSDKVKVSLHPGWNPLLLKITQNNQGWEFCVRLRQSDGSPLQGVRCDCTPKTASAGP